MFIYSGSIAFSQQSNTMYYMDKIPQSNFLNPAKQIRCKYYIGFPALSSVYFNLNNNGLSFIKAFSYNPQQTSLDTANYSVNIKGLNNGFRKLNMLSTEVHLNILSFGLRRNGKYYTFNLTEKNEIYFTYPKDLMSITLFGNSSFEQSGSLASFYKLGVNAYHYREYAFGISKKEDDYLTLGWKAKLLFGKANVRTKADIGLRTKENYHDLTVKSNTQLDISGPINIPLSNGVIVADSVDFDKSNYTVSSVIFNRRNPGIALDGGFIFEYDDRFSYSGSFLDLGFIWWKDGVQNFYQDSEYTFSGLNETDFTSNSTSFAEDMVNELREKIAPT